MDLDSTLMGHFASHFLAIAVQKVHPFKELLLLDLLILRLVWRLTNSFHDYILSLDWIKLAVQTGRRKLSSDETNTIHHVLLNLRLKTIA